MKKIFSTVMALFMGLSVCISDINANENSIISEEIKNIQSEEYYEKYSEELQNKSIEELQKDIETLASLDQGEKSIVNDNMKLAWLAAAQIARASGYPLSATIVERSIAGKNYSETNGSFAKAIKKTSLWKTIRVQNSESGIFEKSMSSDLYYSIHRFSFSSSFSSQGKRMRIGDTFDFKIDDTYKDLFSALVNNWGYLNQGLGILRKISITVNIDV